MRWGRDRFQRELGAKRVFSHRKKTRDAPCFEQKKHGLCEERKMKKGAQIKAHFGKIFLIGESELGRRKKRLSNQKKHVRFKTHKKGVF